MELCFSTDGSCKEDIEELDQAEEDENKGALVRVTNLKDRLKRRGTRRLMTMKPVQVTVDAVSIMLLLPRLMSMQFRGLFLWEVSRNSGLFCYETNLILPRLSPFIMFASQLFKAQQTSSKSTNFMLNSAS